MKHDSEKQVLTFGCRLNSYESEVIADHLKKAGDLKSLVINTCAVTAEAERQARQAIRKAKRDHPDLEIIVTGCSAQLKPQVYADMPEVSRVIGNQEKLRAETWGHVGNGRSQEKILVNDIMSVTETALHLMDGLSDRSRAFVQVQNGCNHRCTFCIIPYARGNSRSVPVVEVVRSVQYLVEQGCQEVVLTGVDLTSYGEDLPGQPKLGALVRRILALVPDLPRLRISSIDCIEMDEDLFIALQEEPRLMPHLHLSLQSGDDMILKRMKRRHLRVDVLALCAKLRQARPDIILGADFIVGFPTEDEAMFDQTLDMVRQADLCYLHVFPYSAREGTPAARIPNKVPSLLAKERAAVLRSLGQEQLRRHMQEKLGSVHEVLVEKSGQGRDAHYFLCAVQRPDLAGTIVRFRSVAIHEDSFIGTVIL